VLRHCCRGKGVFRLRELLDQSSSLEMNDETSLYFLSEIAGNRLLYFATSIFWKSSIYKWPIGRDSSQLLKLGPFEGRFRRYLLGQVEFPSNAAIVINVSSKQNPNLGSSYPQTHFGANALCYHRFYIPGMMFTLYLGRASETIFRISVNAPEHGILVGPTTDDFFMQEIIDFIRRSNIPRKTEKLMRK
jgi:hypothetical protein